MSIQDQAVPSSHSDRMISSTTRTTSEREVLEKLPKDGRSSTPTKHHHFLPNSSTRSSDSILVDHSLLSAGCKEEEPLRCLRASTFTLPARTTTMLPSNSTSIKLLRQSNLSCTEISHSLLAQATAPPCQRLTLSGVKESDSMANSLPTRRERTLKSRELETAVLPQSNSTRVMEAWVKDSRLFISMRRRSRSLKLKFLLSSQSSRLTRSQSHQLSLY